MDWFSWLSRTNLDPSLVYKYGLAFARNELQEEDIAYFNHDFLMSIGISIAKHRLEILKLAKEGEAAPIGLSKLLLAIKKTKNNIKKCANKLVFHKESGIKASPQPARYREQWRDGLTRTYKSEKEFSVEKLPVIRTRRQPKSGPLDGRAPESLVLNHRSLKLSGPLDGRVPESLVLNHRSLKLSGPLDRRVPESLVFGNRNLKVSGPLDGKVHDRLLFCSKSPKLDSSSDINQRLMVGACKSPRIPKPRNGNNQRIKSDDSDHKLLWAALFQDMKPT